MKIQLTIERTEYCSSGCPFLLDSDTTQANNECLLFKADLIGYLGVGTEPCWPCNVIWRKLEGGLTCERL